MSANYSIVKTDTEKIVVQDLGPWDKYQTVTNAAEEVVREIYKNNGSKRIFYYDSENELTELVHENGEFKNYRPA